MSHKSRTLASAITQYVRDTLTEKVYMNNPHFLEELQENFQYSHSAAFCVSRNTF